MTASSLMTPACPFDDLVIGVEARRQRRSDRAALLLGLAVAHDLVGDGEVIADRRAAHVDVESCEAAQDAVGRIRRLAEPALGFSPQARGQARAVAEWPP